MNGFDEAPRPNVSRRRRGSSPAGARRWAVRCLNVLMLAGFALTFGPPPAPPAEAAAKQTLFVFGTDQFNSYWRNQQEVQVQPPQCPPVGPCLSVPVRLSNPDGADALPVSVSPETKPDGTVVAAEEKVSAILFDLSARDVPAGADITLFTLSILEEGTRNADGKNILACRISDIWAHNETGAELWANRPSRDTNGCVTGRRNVNATEIRWQFTLTAMAKGWGIDPSENNGIMLLPEIPEGTGATESWQVTLKVPQPDKVTTTDINEYEDTKQRVRVVYDFKPPPPEPTDDGGDTGSSGGGFTGGGSTGGTDTGPIDTGPTAVPSAEPSVVPEPVADTKEPGPPGQVWLLVPLGLVALAMTRSAVEESVGEAGAGRGVVSAIRRRNATARGEPAEGGGDEPQRKGFLGRFRR